MQAPRKRKMMMKSLFMKRSLMLPNHSRNDRDFGFSEADGDGGRGG